MPVDDVDDNDDKPEDEEQNIDDADERFFLDNPLDSLRLTLPEQTPEERAAQLGRFRCSLHMHDVRTAELNAVAEKWLDHFLAENEDATIPKSKDRMLRMLTEVVLPACRIFGLHDDADLTQKLTPDHTAIELLIEAVDDYLSGDAV